MMTVRFLATEPHQETSQLGFGLMRQNRNRHDLLMLPGCWHAVHVIE